MGYTLKRGTESIPVNYVNEIVRTPQIFVRRIQGSRPCVYSPLSSKVLQEVVSKLDIQNKVCYTTVCPSGHQRMHLSREHTVIFLGPNR